MRGDARLGVACGLLLTSLVIVSQAGPVDRANIMQAMRLGNDQQSSEVPESQIGVFPQNTTIAEYNRTSCTVGEIEYMIGDNFDGSTPCEKCACAPNGVVCDHIRCEVRPGCKALHKADRCCPLYQCECERNGTVYSNGEKLVDPENPCQVCYCQSGQIVCTKIACFRRDDCEPRYVAGRCCPEYDHCPPRDMEMENHIHSKEPSSLKPDNEKFDAPSGFTDGYKMTTENAVIMSEDSFASENNRDEVGGIFRNGDYLSDVDRNSPPLNINEDDNQESAKIIKNTNKIDQRQTINIKEVTQDKSVNNEIRIKEVLPITNFDVSSYSTKSPTIPREVSYESSKESEEKFEKINIPEKRLNSQDKTSNNEAFPTPPILRIGDQLLYLKLGDLVPENGTLSTPSSVFTVIGAEGLQRVEDDPEEMYDHKDDKKNDSPDPNVMISIKDESNLTEYVISNTETPYNESLLNTPQNDNKLTSIITNEDFLNHTETEDPNEIFQEVISELYASTTAEPQAKSSEESSEEEKDDLLFNTINDTKVSESNLYSTEIISKETSGTEDPITIAEKSSPDQPLDDEQQPIPIEHLPEHNPEYPPIPEDIMVLTMTEDSLESGSSEMDFSGGSPIDSQEVKFDEKTPPAKRPALLGPTKQNKNNNVQKESTSEKILPDVLHLVRTNKTNETKTGVPLIPEDWLKSTEGNKGTDVELNSPLLTLSSALPDIILQTEFKDSSEEDDTKIYIFVNNDTLNSNLNSVSANQPEEITTDDPIIQTTELMELGPEFRSPGEPHLVPEWERNQTSTEISEDSSENFEMEQTEDPFILMTTLDETPNQEEIMKEASVILMDKEINTTPNDEHSSNEITPLLEYYRSSSPSAGFRVDIGKESSSHPSNDDITHPITTTEHSISRQGSGINFNTENKANFHSDTEVMQNFDSYDIGAHTKKQKKTSSLLAAEMKNDNSNDLTKKGNILADLINLVGDVAAMGTHDVEISTVSNSIDVQKFTENPKMEEKVNMPQMLTVKPISTTARTTTQKPEEEHVTVEFSEFTPSNDKIDVDIPTENEKVEVTTKKTYIDKDGDERNTWKSTDYIVKDIEIIPKVGNKISKKNSSLERIITKDDTKNDVETASTTQFKKVATITPATTSVPRIPIIKEKIEKVLVDGRKNTEAELKPQLKKGAINVSGSTQVPYIQKIEEKLKIIETVITKNDANILSNIQAKKVVTVLPLTTEVFNIPNVEEKTIAASVIENIDGSFRTVNQLKEMVPIVQITTMASPVAAKKERKSDRKPINAKSSEESLSKRINKDINNVPITTSIPTFNDNSESVLNNLKTNDDSVSNTQEKRVPTVTQAPRKPEEKIKTTVTEKTNLVTKANAQLKKLVTIAPLTIQTTLTPIVEDDTGKIVDANKNEDVIIYTTFKTSSSPPTAEVIEQLRLIPDSVKLEPAPVIKKDIVNLESVQRPLTEQATTESPGVTSTVMKVSSRTTNEENSPEHASTENGRDKLTKRETNSQLTDPSGKIDESLISIMRDFFEKQYRQ